jgi:hypothetical protein
MVRPNRCHVVPVIATDPVGKRGIARGRNLVVKKIQLKPPQLTFEEGRQGGQKVSLPAPVFSTTAKPGRPLKRAQLQLKKDRPRGSGWSGRSGGESQRLTFSRSSRGKPVGATITKRSSNTGQAECWRSANRRIGLATAAGRFTCGFHSELLGSRATIAERPRAFSLRIAERLERWVGPVDRNRSVGLPPR